MSARTSVPLLNLSVAAPDKGIQTLRPSGVEFALLMSPCSVLANVPKPVEVGATAAKQLASKAPQPGLLMEIEGKE